jgi:hypothetical protein
MEATMMNTQTQRLSGHASRCEGDLKNRIGALAERAKRLPLVATGGYADPYLDVVYRYFALDGDIVDIFHYFEHAVSIQACPYSCAR